MVIEEGSHKARKMISTIESSMSKDKFLNAMRTILHEDILEDEYFENIWKKYEFASKFYKDESMLILSLTFRGGRYKSYSFHSPRFLVGVVEYRSVS